MYMNLPKRNKNRLENYDYSTNGVYFVTICTHSRKKLFCDIVPSENGTVGAGVLDARECNNRTIRIYIQTILQ